MSVKSVQFAVATHITGIATTETAETLCGSVDWRQTNFGEQLREGRVAVKAGETLVTAKIQHEFVMRLDADGQVLERFALVAQPSLGLRHKIG